MLPEFPPLTPCAPPFWAGGGHAQTVLGNFLPSAVFPEKGERVEIPLSDGDKLVGRYHAGERDRVVYLFHGLGGHANGDYMRRTARVCRNLGFHVYCINHRGCGEGAGLARHPYHSGRSEDLSAVIALGRARHPRMKHAAVGFSLSGNALLLLLSGTRGGTLPDCAVAVNAPIDLARCAVRLKTGLNRIYDARFVLLCTAAIRARQRAGLIRNKYIIPWFATLHDFDGLYTAPAGGFQDREDYYRSCSTRDLLSSIKTPTVIITAKDDPFVGFEDYASAALSPSVHLHAENVGGHMGYLSAENTPLGTNRWLDYALHEYLVRLLDA
ncbi:MAG: YheT family hydrolase [Elusimicrobiota bacterium]